MVEAGPSTGGIVGREASVHGHLHVHVHVVHVVHIVHVVHSRTVAQQTGVHCGDKQGFKIRLCPIVSVEHEEETRFYLVEVHPGFGSASAAVTLTAA